VQRRETPSGKDAASVKKLLWTVAVAVVLAAVAAPANAGPIYSFHCITSNGPSGGAGDCAIGEAQLRVEVIERGDSLVGFKFTNAVGAASSITDIYFDDGTLLGIASIMTSGAGVAFAQGADPGDLPGGNDVSPSFVTTAGFSADSDSPVPKNGVSSATEWVEIKFDLQSSGTYADVIEELASGELRIGIHVQSFASGASQSFINNPTPVPEPGTLFLLGAGLTGLALRRRRR
jgi:hypothetical protein